MLIDLYADTKRQELGIGDFVIAQHADGWDWSHKNWLTNGVTGTCPTMWAAIAAAHAASEKMLSDKLDAMTAKAEGEAI